MLFYTHTHTHLQQCMWRFHLDLDALIVHESVSFLTAVICVLQSLPLSNTSRTTEGKNLLLFSFRTFLCVLVRLLLKQYYVTSQKQHGLFCLCSVCD